MNTKTPCVLPELENLNWREEAPFDTTYEMLRFSAEKYADRPAITFLADVDKDAEVKEQSYAELFKNITRTANLFHSFGLQRDDVVSVVLPNLFESHEVLWGGEAAGIVNPISPFLEAIFLKVSRFPSTFT